MARANRAVPLEHTPAVPTAIVSDIHANAEALRTVLHDIESRGITDIICLGDVVGYGPEPLACVDLVRERCRWCLMGNHDYAVLYEPTSFNPAATASAYWTRDQFDAEPNEHLRRERYEFLGRLRVRVIDAIGGETPVLAVHGSPRKPINEYIFDSDPRDKPDKMDSIFRRVDRTALVGHTHVPGVYTDEPDFYKPDELGENGYVVNENEKAIVNVGSIGQPRDGDPRASYVVYHAENGSPARFEFVRVAYEISKTVELMRRIPELTPWLADRLFEGQ